MFGVSRIFGTCASPFSAFHYEGVKRISLFVKIFLFAPNSVSVVQQFGVPCIGEESLHTKGIQPPPGGSALSHANLSVNRSLG